jgi:uncharacterized protein YbjT (DUF2867 family)
MKFVVIGGSGLIGTHVVATLRDHGHEVVAASPRSGVDILTGQGLAQAVEGAQVLIDVSNSPSFEDRAVFEFFRKSTLNLVAAARAAGVQHYVALSVVGTERLLGSGYFRAKLLQESMIEASGLPFTIVRATQFFEFIAGIADSGTSGDTVRLPAARFQPMAARDVSELVAQIAQQAPARGIVEIAGPEAVPIAQFVSRQLHVRKDPRTVVAAADAPYFGMPLEDDTLVARPGARQGAIRFDQWLGASGTAAGR